MTADPLTFVDPTLTQRLQEATLDDAESLAAFLGLRNPWVLTDAITRWEAHLRPTEPNYDFSLDLLPELRAWAMDAHPHRPLSVLRAGSDDRVTLSQRHIRHLLACAFFLGTEDTLTTGSLGLDALYNSQRGEAVERVVCLLAYFHAARDASDEPSITFARHRLERATAPAWESLDLSFGAARVRVHAGRMEDSPAPVFFDFANRDLHIHAVIPSLTQEEVLFSVCPELFPGVLLCERMQDDEVIVIDGARRFCDYSGYLRSFRFEGLLDARPVQEVLAADAVFYDHFARANVLRDLDKAWLGFTSCRGRAVSTGHWGCGAFGGNRVAKFLQQSCAAAVAGVELDYSTFRDEDTAAMLCDLHADLAGAAIGEVVRRLVAYEGPGDDDALVAHMRGRGRAT